MLTAEAPAAPPPGATPPAAGTAPTATPPATPPNATPPAAPSNLVTPPASGPMEIPEKFKVAKQDGAIDYEASLQKALGSVAHLEKRLGSGDVPPETETGYKLDYSAFPEGVKITPEGEKSLLKSLHSVGMTNKQVQTVINKYGEIIKVGQEILKQQEQEGIKAVLNDVETELRTSWGETADTNVKAAQRGFAYLADDTDKADMAKLGKDAKVTYRTLMKVLAKVGAGITEDRQITNSEGVAIDADLATLQKSEAYLKADHPDHATVKAKVTALYQKKYPGSR